MTPYEVFFFSSGGVEEHWKPEDLGVMRANVFIGFPLGGVLSLAIAGCAGVVLMPEAIEVGSLSQVALPVAVALGKIGAWTEPRQAPVLGQWNKQPMSVLSLNAGHRVRSSSSSRELRAR